eukprot:7576231-Alexandrium_andersonii.AAC.1
MQSAASCHDTPALGWEFYLDRGAAESPSAPGEVAKACRCCKAVRLQQDPRASHLGGREFTSQVRVGSVLPAAALGGGARAAGERPEAPTPV